MPTKPLNIPFESLAKDLGINYRQIPDYKVRKVLASLTPKEEYIIKACYGFDGRQTSRVVRTIAQDYGLTTKRIYQIKAKALRKLRHPSRIRPLLGLKKGEPRSP